MNDDDAQAERPGACILTNRVFTLFQDVSFRRSPTDGTAVMTLNLGDRQGVVPLDALAREFGIDDASADGRMLELVVQSLDFVTELHPGDPFPREVVDGTASWAPGLHHRALAHSRLQRGLLAWLDGERGAGPNVAAAIQNLEADAALRDRVAVALRRAAMRLGLASPEQVVTLIEQLADELSYIEALRERLLAPVRSGERLLLGFCASTQLDGDRAETLSQVRRLAQIASREIGSRFDEVDAQTGEIMSVLRNAESQRSFIRSHRDWLYRNLRAWEPTLRLWTGLGAQLDEEGWLAVTRSYQFLAQRYMQTQEWQSTQLPPRPNRSAKLLANSMQW